TCCSDFRKPCAGSTRVTVGCRARCWGEFSTGWSDDRSAISEAIADLILLALRRETFPAAPSRPKWPISKRATTPLLLLVAATGEDVAPRVEPPHRQRRATDTSSATSTAGSRACYPAHVACNNAVNPK